MCFAPKVACDFSTSAVKKSSVPVSFFTIFHLHRCFAPQRRAIFEHRNFKNGSDNEVFCAFWLTNVLRATVACHFWTSELPNWSAIVVFCAFWLENVLRATAACHFSSVLLNSYLRTRGFTEATFRTSGSTNHWKNTAIRDVPNIWRTRTFFLMTLHAVLLFFLLTRHLYSAWHLYSAFQLFIVSEVRLLNFLRLLLMISFQIDWPKAIQRSLDANATDYATYERWKCCF